MQPPVTDEQLATDLDAQFELLRDAYATKDQEQINQAIYRVFYARREREQGLDAWPESAA
ncbi:hypothetical protein ETW23_14510 [Leisingera sp. NJS201]|uniref:hypothetical protein n=1 Tax=Leisingera sp. NJS201 TaxID=2508306 RepID=UPI001070ABAF|nr:hypothetical protein [Leisingera sp. NJS201]QBR37165.1 hypothetical protein ETW23_14510 [Leisingera sp. NJS201]